MKTRKKWLRKTTAICTAALLGTAVIPSTAFAADGYASIEKNAWAEETEERKRQQSKWLHTRQSAD